MSRIPISFLCFLISYAIGFNLVQNTDDVVFISLIWRHGQRNPISTYPKDPYNDVSYFPEGWGQLTDEGRRGHYEVGKWLRKRYNKLLPKKYNASDIYIRSSDMDRTLMSAYSNLAGLYEPDLKSNWNPKISWTPIPVHTQNASDDTLFFLGDRCDAFTELYNNLLESSYVNKIDEAYDGLYQNLSFYTGLNMTSLSNVVLVSDALYIEQLKGYNVPWWSSELLKTYPSILGALFTLDSYTPKMSRLNIGPLIGDISNNLKQKAKGSLSPNFKAYAYSGHDITIADTLQALGIFNEISPPFNATVIFELRKIGQNFFVDILYRNSSAVEPYLLTLPKCSALCPLDTFLKITKPLIPEDWEKECESSTKSVIGYRHVTT